MHKPPPGLLSSFVCVFVSGLCMPPLTKSIHCNVLHKLAPSLQESLCIPADDMFCFPTKWRKTLVNTPPSLIPSLAPPLFMAVQAQVALCKASRAGGSASHIRKCAATTDPDVSQELTIGWGMRISVLSPSLSFSTFCPATDWKLIFTMARCHAPSLGPQVPSPLARLFTTAAHLYAWNTAASPRRRSVLVSQLGRFSVVFVFIRRKWAAFFLSFFLHGALKGAVRREPIN